MNSFLTPPICEYVTSIAVKSRCYKSFLLIIFTGLQTKSDASCASNITYDRLIFNIRHRVCMKSCKNNN